jgi:hypothetical protein
VIAPDTAQQIITGVRVLLRRPSDIKLPDDDILEVINDLCREYIQEESLTIRERRTEVSPITITALDTPLADFTVSLPGIPDFEPEKLEYASATGPLFAWAEATIVPFESWARHFNRGYAAAAFYGSSSLSTPYKVKLSWSEDQAALLQFRLSYRLPLITVIQLGDKPPIPAGHLPMLKREASILCAALVKDDSTEWVAWMERTIPLYVSKLGTLKKNWRDYLESSVEPQIQPIGRSDRYGGGVRRLAPFIPPQP